MLSSREEFYHHVPKFEVGEFFHAVYLRRSFSGSV